MAAKKSQFKAVKLHEHDLRAVVMEKTSLAYHPTSVYRLQLNLDFPFQEAISVLPYLKDLGIDAVYLSPIFQAVPGSRHGYNVTDPNKINPEIGSEDQLHSFSDALKQLGMGLILDVVSNHMGIASNNKWWLDVLENGQSSRYAHFFDIDWEPVKKELKDKILLPVLGDQYGVVLENREIQLCFSEGAFFICYADKQFPVAPDTYPQILEYEFDELKAKFSEEDRDLLEYLSILASLRNLPLRTEKEREKIDERNREKEIAKERLKAVVERSAPIREFIESRLAIFNGRKRDPKSFDLLDGLLNLQSYRLAYWSVASEEINYRRFFDVNELAAIRVEDEEVFGYYHRSIFELLEKDKIQGLRIDHPDGLYDPVAYFRKLQQKYLSQIVRKELAEQYGPLSHELEEAVQKIVDGTDLSSEHPLYIVVEKILDRKEDLPNNWSVYGSVGYDFLNALNGLFIARKNERTLTEIYERFTGEREDFDQLVYEKKKFFAAFYMSSEVNTLAHRLNLISEKVRRYRDFTLGNLTTALREVIACFPVYRTYIRGEDTSVSERDERYIHRAVEKAKRQHPALSPTIFDFLKQVLLGRFEEAFPEDERRLFQEFVLKFQQLTAPIMAKGLEDTVFYIYNRLLSLNEVGGDPIHFGYSRTEFHRQNTYRRKRWPYSFITSSTHDTKRSVDVRMRLNVLSEIPEEWGKHVESWSSINERHKSLINGILYPERNTEYFIYQTLIGVWPNEPIASEDFPAFRDRLWACLLKSIREAKTLTNWLNPHSEYEEAVRKFVFSLLSQEEGAAFLERFLPFQKKVAGYGMLNALSAIVLKVGSPGVVDYYQGAGVWNYTLVDPDNRNPVDFELRKSLLAKIQKLRHSNRSQEEIARDLLRSKEDSRIKMFLLWKGLNFRKQHRKLFLEGDYIPLTLEGEKEQNVVAFMRKKGERFVVVACSRFFTDLISGSDELPLGEKVWKDTLLVLPENLTGDLTLLTDCFTQRRIPVTEKGGQRVLLLSDMFENFSVAMLTNLDLFSFACQSR